MVAKGPIQTKRVSPSGKALASQASIRGFESHHPLLGPLARVVFFLPATDTLV